MVKDSLHWYSGFSVKMVLSRVVAMVTKHSRIHADKKGFFLNIYP